MSNCKFRRLASTLLATWLLFYCSNSSLAQVNFPQESRSPFSLSETWSRLWAGIKHFFKEGPSTEFISPVEVKETVGANPQPVPVISEENYPYQAQSPNYKLGYNYNSGGLASPTPPPAEEENEEASAAQLAENKSPGEVIGDKVDRTSREINGWTQDTNVLIALVFAGLVSGVGLISLIIRRIIGKTRQAKSFPPAALVILVLGSLLLVNPSQCLAYSEMNSASYKIKDWDLTQGGGRGTSNSYLLDQAVGQAFQGLKAGSAYKIREGIFYYQGVISLVCAEATVNLPAVTSGTPQNTTGNCTVTTDSASGYQLYASENQDLEHDIESDLYITPVSLGSYGSPLPWETGTDLGLGFSLSGASVQNKWNGGGNFSSFVSGSPGEINNYATAVAGGTNITFTYQIDVTADQKAGGYQNEVSYYATTDFFQ